MIFMFDPNMFRNLPVSTAIYRANQIPCSRNINSSTHPISNFSVDSGVGSENVSRQHSTHTRGSSSDEPSPPPSTRRGRLQKLANQINNWEDDLSHPNIRHAETIFLAFGTLQCCHFFIQVLGGNSFCEYELKLRK